MKSLFFLLLVLVYSGLAQDSSETITLDQQKESTTNNQIKMLDKNAYQKFYIGFTSIQSSMELITLDIRDTQSNDSSISFQYTLNTKDTREEGIGEILPEFSLIRFQNLQEGRISVPEDGKIIFESVIQDSLNYWKLKEK